MTKTRKKEATPKSIRIRRSYKKTRIKAKSGTKEYQREYYALTRRRRR